MPLGEPPPEANLRRLPPFEVAGEILHRVFRPVDDDGSERTPWWFSSAPTEGQRRVGGRFDLPTPEGACYLALTAVAAVLEVFQDFGDGLIPMTELGARVRLEAIAPDTAPVAASLADPAAYGIANVTAALWGAGDTDPNLMSAMRAKTQRWAGALRAADWRALHHGIQHDPSGAQRAITLFDKAGAHAPDGDDEGWSLACEVRPLLGDRRLLVALRNFGVHVAPSEVDLPLVELDESGLL